MGLVMDTSALIALERAKSLPITELPLDEVLVIPAIVWAEAMLGVHLAASVTQATKRKNRLEQLKSQHQISPFTEQMAECYSAIYAELSQKVSFLLTISVWQPQPVPWTLGCW
jgi:predicted nucleic acid-binding protein